MRRFSFISYQKLILYQCPQQHDAHLVGHGQKEKVFEDVLWIFVANIDGIVWNTIQNASLKTLFDKFRNILRARRSENNANEASSSNLEVMGDLYQLFDDIIVPNDDDKTEKNKIHD